ncbi:hypothetical protein BC936DRAFT_145890 [Jimgerdemannia flammicorona]|uniref:Rab3GAP catalytic subunit C-terminal domain-containing protein n=1 Tax=Jimgerdemannia flammicorona TaxID=994334 RepID=A0A433D8Y8_9FUNG|nr:hypothetical protein BC936DRAFT_145890 [Jimgerdemannia flammicorona]
MYVRQLIPLFRFYMVLGKERLALMKLFNWLGSKSYLPRQYRQVERLLESSETDVADGDERSAVYDLFAGASPGSSFPQPAMREFVLYTEHPRPSPVSRPVPQRMYASLKDDEFRVVEMTSTDTIYA